MDLNTFNNKRVVDGKVLLTEPTILFKEDTIVFLTHRVEADEVGRPDLISLTYYGVDDGLDLILKWNGISNPFSLNEGDEIEIPVYATSFSKFTKPNRQTGSSAKDKFTSQRKMTQKDIKRLDFLQQKASQLPNGSKEVIPPNRHKTGDTNTVIQEDIFRSSNPSNFNS